MDSRTEPDLRTLSVIRSADMVMNLLQRYITTAILPLAGTSVTTRREMGIFNNHLIVRMEGKINAIVGKVVDGELLLTLELRRGIDVVYLDSFD
jgi:exocyst complex component 5